MEASIKLNSKLSKKLCHNLILMILLINIFSSNALFKNDENSLGKKLKNLQIITLENFILTIWEEKVNNQYNIFMQKRDKETLKETDKIKVNKKAINSKPDFKHFIKPDDNNNNNFFLFWRNKEDTKDLLVQKEFLNVNIFDENLNFAFEKEIIFLVFENDKKFSNDKSPIFSLCPLFHGNNNNKFYFFHALINQENKTFEINYEIFKFNDSFNFYGLDNDRNNNDKIFKKIYNKKKLVDFQISSNPNNFEYLFLNNNNIIGCKEFFSEEKNENGIIFYYKKPNFKDKGYKLIAKILNNINNDANNSQKEINIFKEKNLNNSLINLEINELNKFIFIWEAEINNKNSIKFKIFDMEFNNNNNEIRFQKIFNNEILPENTEKLEKPVISFHEMQNFIICFKEIYPIDNSNNNNNYNKNEISCKKFNKNGEAISQKFEIKLNKNINEDNNDNNDNNNNNLPNKNLFQNFNKIILTNHSLNNFILAILDSNKSIIINFLEVNFNKRLRILDATECHKSCAEEQCVDAVENCKQCASGYKRKNTSGFPTRCYWSSSDLSYLWYEGSYYFYRCKNGCHTCYDSTKCRTCSSGYYFVLNDASKRCYNSAPTGYFLKTVNSRFEPCSNGCATCTVESYNCLSCLTNYYKIFGSASPFRCYNSAISSSYCFHNNEWHGCYSLGNCSTCQSGNCTSCYSCKSGYYKKYTESFPVNCYNSLSGYYLDSNNWKTCHSSCTTCSNGNSCNSCKSNYFKKFSTSFPTQCYSSLAGYYLSENNWKECDSSCSSCSGSSVNCAICAANHYHKLIKEDPARCYQELSNHFLNNSKWEQCDSSCGNCTSSKSNCTSCANNYYIKFGTNFPTTCYTNLGGYFVDSNSKWKSCDSSCATCQSISTGCLLCATNHYPKINKNFPTECYLNLQGWFLDGNNKYNQCHSSCGNCVSNNTNCTSCAGNYYPKIGAALPGFCYTNLSGWYLDSNKYHQCDSSCLRCVTNKSNCEACASNYYIKSGTNFPTICYQNNIPGWFLDGSNKLSQCDSSCNGCITNSTNCQNCNSNFYPKINQNFPTICYPTNLSHWFLDGNNKYNECDSSCGNCVTNKTNCTTCATNYYLKTGTNFPNNCFAISSGWFLENGKLSHCDSSCATCITNKTNCQSCSTNFYPKINQNFPTICYPTNLSHWFLDGNNKYNECDSSCGNCVTNKTNCTTCATNFYPKINQNFPTICYPTNLSHWFLDGNNKYNECDSTCGNCVTNKTNCTTCATSHYIKSGTNFPTICYKGLEPSGWFISNQKWNKCDNNCKTCSGNAKNCLTCHSNFYLKYGNYNPNICYDTLSQFFLHTDSKWHACDSSCNNCITNKTNCKLCATNFYPKINQNFPTICYPTNLSHWFLDTDNKYNECDSSCGNCVTNKTNCTTCANNYYIKSGTNFPTICYNTMDNYYVTNSQWFQCHASCKNCITTDTNCTECNPNFYSKKVENFPKKCEADIPGYFLKDNFWEICDTSCQLCVSNPKNCKTCKNNYFPIVNTNYPTLCFSVKSGMFLKDNYWNNCDKSCAECITNETNCTQCATNYFKKSTENFPTKCFDTLTGYYMNSGVWKKCDFSCYNCVTNPTNCLECNTNYYPKVSQNYPTLCYKNISSWFLKDKKWNLCDISCKECLGTKTHCTECNTNYFYLEDKKNCYKSTENPIGYYYSSGDKIHKNCDKSCRSCDKAEFCLSCADNYKPLEEDKSICINLSNQYYHYKKNDLYYYYDKLKEEYSKCGETCRICINDKDWCFKCNYDSGYLPLSDKKHTCTKEIENYYFKNMLEQEFTRCHKSCKECSDSTPRCSICEDEYYPKSDLRSSCWKEAPNKTYIFNKKLNNWYKCPYPGYICDEKFRFIDCLEGYFYINHTCLLQCPDGYYNNKLTRKCTPCVPPCKTCENEVICKSCVEKFYFMPDYYQNNCIDHCPGSYFHDNHNYQCRKCREECSTCLSKDICLSCFKGHFFNPDLRECHKYCHEGYYEYDKNNICKKCDPNCRTCRHEEKKCTSCPKTPKVLYLDYQTKKCVEDCPLKTYKSNIYQSCEDCHETCKTCKGGRMNDCLSCDEEKKLKLIYGYCAKGCPKGYIREIGSKFCIDFIKCFNYIILSYPNFFSMTDVDFQAVLNYQLSDECLKYKEHLLIEWEEIPNAIVNGKKLTIPYNLLKEGLLKLSVSVKYNNNIITTLRKESLLILYKLVPVISYEDNLNFQYGYDLIIDGSLSNDEGYKEKKKDENLKFTWFCSGKISSICEKLNDKNESILKITYEEYKIFISNPLKTLTYDIELSLKKDVRSSRKKVKLNIKPKIVKKKSKELNKKQEINLTNMITIIPEIIKGSKFIVFKLKFISGDLIIKDYKYHWTIKSFRSDSQYLNSRKENNLKVLVDDLLSGYNDIYLEIFDPKLKKNYRKIYNYLKPVPPYGGNCLVNPQIGTSLKDNFEFSVSGWATEYFPLLYKIKFLDKDNNLLDISLGGFGGLDNATWKTSMVPVGDNYILEVSDKIGNISTALCQMKVNPNKDILHLEDYLKDIFEPMKKQLLLNIYMTNIEANKENERNLIIALNDKIVQNIYNLLIAPDKKSANTLQNLSQNLLNVCLQPFSNDKIKLLFESVDIIVNEIKTMSENKILIEIIFKLIDNAIKKIENSEVDSKFDMIDSLQSFNGKINNYIANNIISGQSLTISTPAVEVKLSKVSILNVKPISMSYDEDKEFKRIGNNRKHRNYKVRYLQNSDEPCDPEISPICVDESKVKNMMGNLGTENIGFKGQLNKNVKLQIKAEQFSNSLEFYFSNGDENEQQKEKNEKEKSARKLSINNKGNKTLSKNETESNNLKMDFEVRLKLPKNKPIGELGPATCVQYDGTKIADVSCMSYYDLNTMETVCVCNKQGLTVNVKDPALALASKLKQFPPLCKDFFNIYSIGIVGGFMFLFLVFLIFSYIFDYIDHKSLKFQQLENYDFMQFYMNHYHKEKFENKIDVFRLAIYLVKQLHPIISILTIFHPRYNRKLRLFDFFLNVYLTFFFIFLRFYLLGNPAADKFMNDRSLENRKKTINDLKYDFKKQIIGIGYSLISSILTTIIIQIFQLWSYENVTDLNMRRKNKLLYKNMLRLDKDHQSLAMIKIRTVKFKLRAIILLMPKHLRKCREHLKEEKNINKLNEEIAERKSFKEINKNTNNIKEKNQLKEYNEKQEMNNQEIKESLENKNIEKGFKHLFQNENDDETNNNSYKYFYLKGIEKYQELSNDNIIQGNPINNNTIKDIVEPSENKLILNNDKSINNINNSSNESNLNLLSNNLNNNKEIEKNNLLNKNTDNNNNNNNKTRSPQKKKSNKFTNKKFLEKENLLINTYNKLEESSRSLIQEEIIVDKSFRSIEKFEISIKKFNKNSQKIIDMNLESDFIQEEISTNHFKWQFKKRSYTNFSKKKQNISCFSISLIKEEKKNLKINTNTISNTLKFFFMIILFVFLWFMMAVFVNNLVNKYGKSVFEVCVLPVAYMFVVRLFVTENFRIFLMAIVLKFFGKKYCSLRKNPIGLQLLFKALVAPHALDHFQSIIFYQEYTRNIKYLKM